MAGTSVAPSRDALDAAADASHRYPPRLMQRHHKILLAVALLLSITAWLAWNLLVVGSNLAPGN